MSTPLRPHTTAAFFAQASISFAASMTALVVGVAYLPLGAWPRAFLALGILYAVTSAFTLAKVIRDRQEESTVVGRVDQARLDKLLAEQDVLRVNAS
ncbi:MAG TPA: YiaA/YiaB family inner membrane protein [Streptosporangiaceae bacterium]